MITLNDFRAITNHQIKHGMNVSVFGFEFQIQPKVWSKNFITHDVLRTRQALLCENWFASLPPQYEPGQTVVQTDLCTMQLCWI